MSLADAVTGRLSTARLVELTNKGERGTAATVDTTVLGYAVADASAEFETETGLTLDTTIAAHVAAGVAGVIYYLLSYANVKQGQLDAARDRWERAVEKIDRTSGKGVRATPYSASVLDPSEELTNARPDQDNSRWSDYVIGPPAADGEADDT